MQDRLSEERLSKLLPMIPLLAEYISGGNAPDRSIYTKMLRGIGLETEDWAVQELEIWTVVLKKVRDSSSESENTSIVAQLLGRGIPEASAILACHSAKPKPLSVEPERIDLGILSPGEEASATLTVTGGLIKEVLSSKRLNVSLLRTTGGNTLIKVVVSGGNAGESLVDQIILRGDRGELKVPVTARWERTQDKPPLLSWCPDCRIKEKSLFYNHYAREYECLNLICKHKFPYPDKRVKEYNDTHD